MSSLKITGAFLKGGNELAKLNWCFLKGVYELADSRLILEAGKKAGLRFVKNAKRTGNSIAHQSLSHLSGHIISDLY